MSEFDVSAQWIDTPAKAGDEIDATRAQLKVILAGKNVTSFIADDEPNADHIELPLYHVAEWVAENWWALLWEPRKSEDSGDDDGDFIGRHYLLTAEHGFALPHLTFISNGTYLNVTAQARDLPFSDTRFINRSSAMLDRDEVERPLSEFLDAIVQRLTSKGFSNTYMQERWKAVRETAPEAVDYCQMVGALGLSPYAKLDDIDAVLDRLCERIGAALTLELCQVAKPADLMKAERASMLAVASAHKAAHIDLQALTGITCPDDVRTNAAWQRGVRAAQIVRSKLGISATDVSGADKLFDKLELDPSKRASIGNSDLQAEGAAVVGATLRHEQTAQISFIQRHEPQRRFAAARGLFSAWISAPGRGHLLTQAVTRHQQSSRAFAAELLAPLALLRQWATKGLIARDDIDDIATQLRVGPDVVVKQARNNGMIIRTAS